MLINGREINIQETTDQILQEMSPYDVSYPVVLLSSGINEKLAQAQIVVKNIYDAVVEQMPMLTELQQAMQTGCRYVVDVSETTLKAIESGAMRLVEENGNTYAQLSINGRYGSKLPIKKEVFCTGVDPVQVANALQMQAIQEQIQAVREQLVLIEGGVRDVLQGQQNDRIGLYYSGLSLFLESRSITDGGLRSALQAQSLRSLTEATFQLKLNMESDIRYIEQKEYKKGRKESKALLIERMNRINQGFAFIHQATMLRAGIYCNIGELASMAHVLEEYSGFIETVVKKNAVLLAQHDLNDDGTPTGLWAERSQITIDVSELSKALNSPSNVLYLGVAKEEL